MTATSSTRHESVHAEVRVGDSVTKYLRAGTGRAVLLLGSFEPPLPPWPGLTAELAGNFRLIAPQLPQNRNDFATWVRAFLDGLGLLKVSIVATDDVGVAAIGFALLESERVDRLVLLSNDRSNDGALFGGIDDPLRESPMPFVVIHRDQAGDPLAAMVSFLGEE
jgi:pimeloyl-ACP methyl ester carboxylesterase